MRNHASRWTFVLLTLALAGMLGSEVFAQQSTSERRLNRLRASRLSNRAAESDRAAGEFIDSLFASEAPSDPILPNQNQAKLLNGKPSVAQRTASWRGRLISNPNTEDGSPPYILLDRYGKAKRFVEPSAEIDLDAYLGETVTVRRDTGSTLLASQLDLPRVGLNSGGADEIDSAIQLAQYQESMAPEMDPLYLDNGLDFGSGTGGCTGCGDMICTKPGCGFGSRPIFYARGEYSQWWLEGMNTPPLVVQDTMPDTVSDPDVEFLQPGVSVIYGGDRILEDGRDGFRATLGYWFDDYGNWGIEGDYLDLGEITETFSAGSLDGLVPDTRIGRPFIAVAPLAGVLPVGRAVEEVDTEDLDGNVTVRSRSDFSTAGVRFMNGLCCRESCDVGCGDSVGGCDSCGSGIAGAAGLLPGVRRTDFLWGLRWAEFDEQLRVTEDLQERVTNGDTFLVNDIFDTDNQFTGGEVGFRWQWEQQRWSLDLLSKIAIGSTRQRVRINGSTHVNREVIGTEPSPGGLLALPSNIGVYERDQFSIMPELGAKLGYMLTDRLRISAGYTFLYWSNVVRPGDQVDLLVDPNQVPIFDGADEGFSPAFRFIETGLWAQGLDFGAEYRW
ncbi:BBP7 family outer membrane beta-barrel protein [Adhaeretor mobilis]|uniref:Uncharacterized protein n=1 Tax=Adhaeretor mobilis TaxID=1930276 RepID=A0A517MQJ8_9BACT|nr:BBP7 family outer membrane beta-barrel protein [Adhaeretor mobilis]QDS97156.1 hypothetical protein HG15A2_04160 [Adhaeretor mobilis]